ncbi:Retrovirus-related Pol polyprotein from transposon 17.6, partial [Mucuna pruriens]
MWLMNHVLRSLIGRRVVVYFDDILVYYSCMDDHILHVRKMLELLRKESLYVNLEKCIFYTNEVVEGHPKLANTTIRERCEKFSWVCKFI